MLPLSVPVVSSRFAQVVPSRCLISGSFTLIIETLSLDASGAFRTTPFHAFVSGLHTAVVVVIYRVPLREEETALPSGFRLSIIALLGALRAGTRVPHMHSLGTESLARLRLVSVGPASLRK